MAMQQIKQFRGRGSQIGVTNVEDQALFRINVMPAQHQRKDHEVIDMTIMESEEDQVQGQPGNNNFLRRFLRVLRYMGMSAYNPYNNLQAAHKAWLRYCIDILLKVAFWTAVVFAFMSSFLDAKYYWLQFLAFGGLMKFVKFGFHVITILVQAFLLQLFAFLHENITDMLEKLDELNQSATDPNELRQEKRENRIITALVVTTLLKSFLTSGIDKAIANWSIEKTIEDKSVFFYEDIHIWSANDMTNSNVTAKIHGDYSEISSTAKAAMALAQVLMNLCSDLKLETAVDMIIVASLCLLKYTRRMKMRVENNNDNHDTDGNDSAAMNSPSGDWAYYQKLAAANKAINLALDGLLKMMHNYNAMKLAYFLMKLMENKATVSQFLYLLYSCGKVSVAYYIAKKPNEHNVVFQEWIIDWGLRSTEMGFPQKAMLALKKMKLQVLGLGSGIFNIGENFILQFGSKVGSMLMLQVDKAE